MALLEALEREVQFILSGYEAMKLDGTLSEDQAESLKAVAIAENEQNKRHILGTGAGVGGERADTTTRNNSEDASRTIAIEALEHQLQSVLSGLEIQKLDGDLSEDEAEALKAVEMANYEANRAHLLGAREGGGGVAALERTSFSARWVCVCTRQNSYRFVQCQYCHQTIVYPSEEFMQLGRHSSCVFGQNDSFFSPDFRDEGGVGVGGGAVEASTASTSARSIAATTARRIADSVDFRARTRLEAEARTLATTNGLRGLAAHGQNVHAAVIEGQAIKTMDDLVSTPLPPGMSVLDMIENCKQCVSFLQPQNEITLRACDELGSNELLDIEHGGYSFRQVLVGVWNMTIRHKDKVEMTKRLCEEMFEGIGTCPGGRIGRLVNALRGFVDVGIARGDGSTNEMQLAFSRRVLNAEFASKADQLAEANVVLDEFGIRGEQRQGWLGAVSDL